MKTLPTLPAIALLTLSTLIAHAANWPQWRGPELNGTSPETGLPTSWTRDTVKWATPLPGPSGASPIVWGDTVFVTSPDESKNLLLIAVNRKDGSIRWKKEIASGDITKGRANMASPSPVTDGKTVYVLFGTGDFAALDFDGNVLWSRNLSSEYGRLSYNWIYGSSPLLWNGKLYLQVLQRNPAPADYPGQAGGDPTRESFLLCVDPATGKNIWKVARTSTAHDESQESFGTPVPSVGKDGKPQLLIGGGDCVSAHDPATGAELWRGYGLNPTQRGDMRSVPSPVSVDGLVVAAGPKKGPLLAFHSDMQGDISTTGLAWKFDEKRTPDVCTPVYYQGKLFVLDGDSHTLTALDPKTGEKKWQGEIPTRAVVRSSPVAADGKLYFIDEKNNVIIVGAGDQFEVLGNIPMGDSEGTRATIAISNGDLFFRTPQALYCVGK
jgi:outer membrane protein assembly factor BamB